MTDILTSNLDDLSDKTNFPPTAMSSPLPGTGIANLPNQRHKIVAKNGANFTIMVCGKSIYIYYYYFFWTKKINDVHE